MDMYDNGLDMQRTVSAAMMITGCIQLCTSVDELCVKTFHYSDHIHDIDPDDHFDININQQCKYFTEEQ